MSFLPICKQDMTDRGWEQCDFVYVIGDAYVDHPSFGHAIISRILESHGYSVGAQDTSLTVLKNMKTTPITSCLKKSEESAAALFRAVR